MTPENPERELSSWKEVAAHLGVSVRTAQDWERTRGLPVRRMPGPRGRVRAIAAELNRWKDGTLAAAPDPAPEAPAADLAQRGWWRSWWAAAGLAAIAAVTSGFWWLRPGPPVSYRVEPGRLITLDHRGREVWRKDFPDLAPVAYRLPHAVWFGDLDGQPSVLFTEHTAALDGPGPLICYSADGRERWRFDPGRTVAAKSETFGPPFHVYQFLAGKFGRDGATRILVVSFHYLYYPCQVALLDEHGRLLREYWHSGQLDHMLVTDGGRRILLAGIDNATKSATLVSLDPDTMTGASHEENPDYQLQGFAPGVELERLLFPRSDINRRTEAMANVTKLWEHDGEIGIEVGHRTSPNNASVYYHLNHDLTLRKLAVDNGFQRVHAELAATHVLDHELSTRETEALSEIRRLSPHRADLAVSR